MLIQGQIINVIGDEEVTDPNMLELDGRSLNKNEYPGVFNFIGYKFGGEGDYFNLPDCTTTNPKIRVFIWIGATQL